jgi:hypothetical protein
MLGDPDNALRRKTIKRLCPDKHLRCKDIQSSPSAQGQQKDLVRSSIFNVGTSGQRPKDKDNKKSLSGIAFKMLGLSDSSLWTSSIKRFCPDNNYRCWDIQTMLSGQG